MHNYWINKFSFITNKSTKWNTKTRKNEPTIYSDRMVNVEPTPSVPSKACMFRQYVISNVHPTFTVCPPPLYHLDLKSSPHSTDLSRLLLLLDLRLSRDRDLDLLLSRDLERLDLSLSLRSRLSRSRSLSSRFFWRSSLSFSLAFSRSSLSFLILFSLSSSSFILLFCIHNKREIFISCMTNG